ncbi:MAG: S8 family serine peptidase [Bacteroidetes bacterium]|jgi:subtilisin family serine protease|nr:S8 family serine peptidase [Bacteroidota bacterium]
MLKFKLIGLCLILCLFSLNAQDSAPQNWFNLDPSEGVPGVSTEKTYQELLKNRKGQEVVVAVLDSGVDYEHEDLDDVMWVNEDEVPGNGIDDDNNGYIDDVHGWNFLGNAEGENVAHDNLEVTRLYRKYKAMFEGKDPAELSKKEKALYAKYQEYEEVIEKKRSELEQNVGVYAGLAEAMNKLDAEIDKEEVTVEDLEAVESDDPMVGYALQIAKSVMAEGQSFERLVAEMQDASSYFTSQYDYHYNVDFDPRPLINDNFEDPYDRDYGNNDVRGPDAEHGTHVAGLIAAERNNNTGIDGVAKNVKIMSVRTVPDGDERDKDVAAAIVYAVDNGASIINMSFGKGASPRKELVDEAVRYAKKNDVLIIHAAGNDGKEVTNDNNFPTDKYAKRGFLNLFGPKYAENWIEVGALNWKNGEQLAAPFSNYSPFYVDLFAPGMEMYSTVPFDEYKNHQGTSMAAPVVAGVAAMIRSYFPDLTAEQVKDILMQSAKKQKVKVIQPGSTEDMVTFGSLSVTGGVVNAYEAVQLAAQTKGKKRGVDRPQPMADGAVNP